MKRWISGAEAGGLGALLIFVCVLAVETSSAGASDDSPVDALVLVIDQDSIAPGVSPNLFTAADVNDDVAALGRRSELRFFDVHENEEITLHIGQVGDEGWFAPMTVPTAWHEAGPLVGDGARNYVGNPSQPYPHNVGPGLGTGGDPEAHLDKIPDVAPLRNPDLEQLRGQTVCAVVYDGDVSVNYEPLNVSLKGSTLGTVAFEVGATSALTGASSGSLSAVELTIRDAESVCEGALRLFDGTQLIEWAPMAIEATATPGTVRHVPVEVAASTTLDDLSLYVTPKIAPFVSATVEPSRLPEGQSTPLHIGIEVPVETEPGIYGGTVHIRSGGRTFPLPLPVALEVRAPEPGIVPRGVSLPSSDRVGEDASGNQRFVEGEIIAALSSSASDPDELALAIADETGGVIVGSIEETATYQLRYDALTDAASLEALLAEIEVMPNVDSASLNLLAPLAQRRLPNDTEYQGESWEDDPPDGKNWNLESIRALSAWEHSIGDAAVRVAVIDADLNRWHEDLRDNVVGASGPVLSGGHGTHVAGILCAQGDNGKGIAGVAWDCGLRGYNLTPIGAYYSIVEAANLMVQAVDDGARIVNMSLQWIETNQCPAPPVTDSTRQRVLGANRILGRPIDYALGSNRDVLWVFAAGNECRDARYASPASLVKDYRDNTIAVAAIGSDGTRASYSNNNEEGGGIVEIAAPGGDEKPERGVLSTLPCRPLCYADMLEGKNIKGTSQAAPHVAGAAVLAAAEALEMRGRYSAAELKRCLVEPARARQVPGHPFGILDAAATVRCVQLKMDDDFNDNSLDPSRWFILQPPPGIEVRVSETNQRLEVSIGPGSGGGGVVSRCSLAGDFNIQVEYTLMVWPPNDPHGLRLGAFTLGEGPFGAVGVSRVSHGQESHILALPDQVFAVPASGVTGKLRLVRSGSTLSGLFFDGSGWTLIGSGPTAITPTRINLDIGRSPSTAATVSGAFDNFVVNTGTVQCP